VGGNYYRLAADKSMNKTLMWTLEIWLQAKSMFTERGRLTLVAHQGCIRMKLAYEG